MVKVLLLWPGTVGAAAGNFGVPQLVTLATWLRATCGAEVRIVDLVAEHALRGRALDVQHLFEGFDLIAIGVYSSYDFLTCEHLAREARRVSPRALLVAGGYHASARPYEMLAEGVFDVAVVGEAEHPMRRLCEALAGGVRPREVVYESEPVEALDTLPVSDWSYLERYKPVARKVASQAQVYLSRGCPFDCAFCMERAKREVSWRAYSVERALEEMRALARFIDLRGWTVYLADALFGMKRSWRRSFLEALAREGYQADKLWLLIRVDLVEDDDLALFAAANCGLGFGLESGDPAQLAVIRKAGRLDDYLERMTAVAERARALDLPWGANVIVGHPGETEQSLEASAAWLKRLFLDPKGTTGFLSVDPFRLYPGSPIDAEQGLWHARFGTRFHRPSWWHDGDQEFLSEWVDPSSTLDWRRRETLTVKHFGPIVEAIPKNFVYRGPARRYFLRAAEAQARQFNDRARLNAIDRYYAWHRYLGRTVDGVSKLDRDDDTAALLRRLRGPALDRVAGALGLPRDAPVIAAMRAVPRERHVGLDALRASLDDAAVPLTRDRMSSVSAFHAYARSFTLLDLGPGDAVLDLGSATGYGLALMAACVGAEGRVWGIELDPRLVARAEALVGALPGVHITQGDALDPARWPTPRPQKIVAGFALDQLPEVKTFGLADGTVLVAPLQGDSGQWLVRATVSQGQWQVARFEAVQYVPTRSPEGLAASPTPSAEAAVNAPRTPRGRVQLPVVS
ncbi:MAG: radical SAM protein [Myxococcales bacterium]|nr:radical SAM protein [Myxococcales bacterium]